MINTVVYTYKGGERHIGIALLFMMMIDIEFDCIIVVNACMHDSLVMMALSILLPQPHILFFFYLPSYNTSNNTRK